MAQIPEARDMNGNLIQKGIYASEAEVGSTGWELVFVEDPIPKSRESLDLHPMMARGVEYFLESRDETATRYFSIPEGAKLLRLARKDEITRIIEKFNKEIRITEGRRFFWENAMKSCI